LNVTVPVAVNGATAAVSVTLRPKLDGFGEEVSFVAVGVLMTVCVIADDVLARSLTSPPYTAVSE
jgi:ribosomal protein S5